MPEDYRQYYDLESYLFDTVRPRFAIKGCLSVADFFCIVIWKANRSKTRLAERLRTGHTSLDAAVDELTSGIFAEKTAEGRLRVLIEDWGFWLPMASAILTVLYPDDFTVYDQRVCAALKDCNLGDFHTLANKTSFADLWKGYQEFKRQVEKAAPAELKLRDKDRYLWGKAFHKQLMDDARAGFPNRSLVSP